MRISAVCFLLLLGFPSPALAQGRAVDTPFIMNLDFARFRHDASNGYLEIYYQFYCDQLSLKRVGNNLRGAIAVNTDVLNEQTGEVLVRDHFFLPVLIDDTTLVTQQRSAITQSGHFLPRGKYQLRTVAYDSTSPSKIDSISLGFDIKPYLGKPAISDLQLCSSIKSSDNKQDPFYKNAHEVVVNPTLVFGASYPVIYVYVELYDLDTSAIYVANYEIVDDAGTVVKKVSRNRQYAVPSTIEVGSLNAVSLKSGRYLLRFSLDNREIPRIVGSEKRFFVNNPTIVSAESEPLMSMVGSAIEALPDREVEMEFQQVKYLALPSEMYLFTQLSDVKAKRKFLHELWTRVEKGSEAHQSLTRAEYLRNVALANERFSFLTTPGWRTDRGRVLVLYGKPDEIERHPSSGEMKPFEIWYYYHLENGVQFVFIDRSGFGDYLLVHSTKRNELQDPTWEQFLH